MQVTRIEELNKTRCKVFIEQEPAFVLYKGEIRRYHVREGEELAEASYNMIMEEVLPRRAKLRAMNLLLKRDYTTAQLRDKLKQGLYPEPVLEAALDYVASFHYTDDLRYATDFIRCNEQTRSRRRIEQDLMGKGISGDIIKKAWENWEEQGGVRNEEAIISRLLKKRGYHPDTADYNRKQKEAAYLLRKGFSGDSIRRVLQGFEEIYTST